MPGRMGGKQRTVKNVWVYKIDPARDLMWVKGQVYKFDALMRFLEDKILNGRKQNRKCPVYYNVVFMKFLYHASFLSAGPGC